MAKSLPLPFKRKSTSEIVALVLLPEFQRTLPSCHSPSLCGGSFSDLPTGSPLI